MSNASNLGNSSSESGFAVIDVPNGADVHMGLPAQVDPDWGVNHTKQTNPWKWIISNHTSLNRQSSVCAWNGSVIRSTHVRVKVATDLAQRVPASGGG
jgi:hypothetical protein